MWKRPTRKKLIEGLTDLIRVSSGKPVLAFSVEKVDYEDYYDLGWKKTYYDLDEIIPKLMDLSLTYRITKIWCQEYMVVRGVCVCFEVIESKDGTTNIDSELMDLVLRLNCKKVSSWAQ